MDTMQIRIYRITFHEPVRIGESTIGPDQKPIVIHSDSLWSALISAGARLGLVDRLLGDNPTDGATQFTITSAFPYLLTDGQLIYFFPRPLTQHPFASIKTSSTTTIEKDKKLEKSDLVTKDLFEAWICSFDPGLEAITQAQERLEMLNNAILIEDYPNVQLGSLALSSQLFYSRRTFFASSLENSNPEEFRYQGRNRRLCSAGLWFGVTFKNESIKPYLEAALELLSEDGLGGDRSTGNGSFSWETDVVSVKVPSKPNRYVSLSVLSPSAKDGSLSELLRMSSYRLLKRGGWFMNGNIQGLRKQIWVLCEGSVLPQIVEGKIRDVTPEGFPLPHRIYRCGKGFFIGMKG